MLSLQALGLPLLGPQALGFPLMSSQALGLPGYLEIQSESGHALGVSWTTQYKAVLFSPLGLHPLTFDPPHRMLWWS